MTEFMLNELHTTSVLDMYAMIIAFMGFGILLIMLVIYVFRIDLLGHYERGQIDALNGKVKCKLEENNDGEKVWVKIPKTELTQINKEEIK